MVLSRAMLGLLNTLDEESWLHALFATTCDGCVAPAVPPGRGGLAEDGCLYDGGSIGSGRAAMTK